MTRSTTLAVAGSAVALAGITAGAPALPAAGGTAGALRTARSAVPFRPPRPGVWTRGAGGLSVTGHLRSGAGAPATVTLAVYPARSRETTAKSIAHSMLRHRFHWKGWQFKYLNRLWTLESGWDRYARNPYSGAYGIPQALPARKMATAGPDWRTSARTQVLWGLRYIKGRYRTPYWAWVHERACGWY